MKPPATCAALARRLRQDAAPLHGRTYRDLMFAADLLDVLDANASATCAFALCATYAKDPSRYKAEPEAAR
jgi:hypothetical protein